MDLDPIELFIYFFLLGGIVYLLLQERKEINIAQGKFNVTFWLSSRMILDFFRVLLILLVVPVSSFFFFSICISFLDLPEFFGNSLLDYIFFSLPIFIPIVSGFLFHFWINRFYKNQSEKFRSFFEEVQSYHDLISHDLTPGERGDASYPFSVEKGISDILQESENIQTKTKELIQKRRYAWFVFDTPSYRSYKQMIHERIEAMIPLLQKQKMLLQETIEQEQSTLLQAQHTLQDTLTPIPSLQYTAEVQNQRLEKQIQEFEKLRRVVG